MSLTKKILILAANPQDTARLRLDEEVREITEGLTRSKHRERFDIQQKWAVRLKDLRRALLDHEPQIVHFCGHAEIDGLMVADEQGNAVLVSADALAGLFELFAESVECVLLNACYSEIQAAAINQHINYVIGMNAAIRDDAALEFAVGFYDALGAGRSVEDAFKFGCNAIQLHNLPEHLIPVLKKNPKLVPARIETLRIEPQLLKGHHFVCYAADGKVFALELYAALKDAGVPVWIDQHDAQAGSDYNAQVVAALQTCHSLLFVLTPQSVANCAECAREWKRALSYKKPIIPLQLDATVEIPFELEGRQPIAFTGVFEEAVKRLRDRLRWLTTPAGQLALLQERLADAQRALRQTTDPIQQARAQTDIEQLQKDIVRQEQIVKNPQAAEERVKANIERGIERERQPEKPVSGQAWQKFINPPPGIAPTYFQDRHLETKLVADFLNDAARRLLIVAGRAGIGKTAMVCRLLKSLESGQLPDNIGALRVDGIVYLSAVGTRKINIPHLYADLAKLLPAETAQQLDNLYRDPHVSTPQKIAVLLEYLGSPASCLQPDMPAGCRRSIILLLDNFEDALNPETRDIADAELDEGLRAILTLPQHPVKVIITTRIPPKALMFTRPERQQLLRLDEGLDSPYAENILREMDVDGKVGLKNAPENLLQEAKARTMGYPRALEALFAILAADRDTTLPEILAAAEHALPENVVETLVGEMFNRLDLPAQMVMQALAIYHRPVTATAVDYLLEPYLPGVDSALALGRLVNMQFARKEGKMYYLHPVDRAYALSRIPKKECESGAFAAAKAPLWHSSAFYHRGAEYFKQTRKPCAEWQKLDDLLPQLAEIELRCAGEEYDAAADVLTDIDFNYLLLWGHYRLMIDLHERLQGKINDPTLKLINVGNLGTTYRETGQVQKAIVCYEQVLVIAREKKDRWNEGVCLGNLGNAYAALGQTARAIESYEQALAIAREIGDRRNEGTWLGNLGGEYAALGQTARAIEYYEQALVIDREIGDRRGEGADLGNLGNRYADLGQTVRAIEYYEQALTIACEIGDRPVESIFLENIGYVFVDQNEFDKAMQSYQQAIQIADEIGFVQTQNCARWELACAYLYIENLSAARVTAEDARKYDQPQNNHNVCALLGVIALRQGDVSAAQEAFTAAIAHADKLLGYTAQNYDALDAKGLALCGLALCAAATPRLSAGHRVCASPNQHPESYSVRQPEDKHPVSCGQPGFVEQAIAAFQAARQITTAAGIVGRVLRLFDALAAADAAGLLADVRQAAAGNYKDKT